MSDQNNAVGETIMPLARQPDGSLQVAPTPEQLGEAVPRVWPVLSTSDQTRLKDTVLRGLKKLVAKDWK